MMGKTIIIIIIVTVITVILKNIAFAQSLPCPLSPSSSPKPRAEGLITTPQLSGKFGTTGACVVDPKAAFVPFKIPTYDDLKFIYYSQAQSNDNIIKHESLSAIPSGGISLGSGKDHLYQFSGDLTIDNPADVTGGQTGIIFIEGTLNLGPLPSNKFTTPAEGGVVFVVKGDVIIDPTVEQIEAIIISAGTIFTAGNGCLTSAVVEKAPGVAIEQLVINGSLIALNPDNKIRFCRNLQEHPTLSNFDSPAEIINNQPKYLVLLRHIMSEIVQKWSEIP